MEIMGTIGYLVKKLFPNKEVQAAENIEELRLDFKERYYNFKLLISANNKSIEIMANIEHALQGKQPFGMTFVRSNCTAISVNVFRMIKKLKLLAPGKYDELSNRFRSIRGDIDRILLQKRSMEDQRLVIPLSAVDKDMTDLVGSKMANLGEIKNKINLDMPDGFVITAFAYNRFIQHNDLRTDINRRFQFVNVDDMEKLYTLHAEIQQLILRSEVPVDLEDAILEAWQQTEDAAGFEITAALRSSALGEDEAGSSFAGMHRSELNISADYVLQAYKEIVASKYSLPAIIYRLHKGFRDEDISMCVGCLVMVDAKAGGVIYSRNPVDVNDDSIFINAAWGLPKAVVDGRINCDLLVVSRQKPMKIIHQDIKVKEKKFVCYPLEGICRIDLTGDIAALPTISRGQAVALAELAVKMEEYYNTPQDIEWCIGHDERVYVLQCRPLQQKAKGQMDYPDDLSRKVENSLIARGGITASPGTSSGTVYLVGKEADILNFPARSILVTNQALPIWASLLSRASGVITQQGGFAGHLANVAREFEVPALFGVQDAIKQLKNGELITLDADAQSIYKGRIDHLLTKSKVKRQLMEGSPVYETLKQAGGFIVPLNLRNPASPDFNQENCRTLHDITRFIHEKSVQEMFDFGKKHHFNERSAKQLYYKVPMQWWLLNLDDGFKEEVEGKYVKLENIASIPMLAFWEGFTAIPWDGPPAIDGKGFMSVMFQSASNRPLLTRGRSGLADRNYFMISKNFSSLHSRLGYHFSLLEALVGERHEENYVKFQFKGGAADYERRLNRVLFIGDLLEKYGFRIQVTEDNLVARVEGEDLEYMKQRIEILGYLSIHTRQIDMVMLNEPAVNRYRAKFTKDIDFLLCGHTRKFC
jgi:pyruvate,water dikinase